MAGQNTCGNCPHVKAHPIPMTGVVWACSNTIEGREFVVPQSTERKPGSKEWVTTFWRVPLNCPRPDTVKSDEKAPREDWVVVRFEQ